MLRRPSLLLLATLLLIAASVVVRPHSRNEEELVLITWATALVKASSTLEAGETDSDTLVTVIEKQNRSPVEAGETDSDTSVTVVEKQIAHQWKQVKPIVIL